MRLYCGIDLHSNNAYLVVLDEQDHVIYVLSLQNLYQRSTGRRLTSGELKTLDLDRIEQQLADANVARTAAATFRIFGSLDDEVQQLEKEILRQLQPDPLLKLPGSWR